MKRQSTSNRSPSLGKSLEIFRFIMLLVESLSNELLYSYISGIREEKLWSSSKEGEWVVTTNS